MSTLLIIVLLKLLTLSSVCSTQMEWGDNPDLVDLHTIQQGREHIKLLVVFVGESIDLECRVLFATYPVNEMWWKLDGEIIRKPGDPIVTTTKGDVFIEYHLQIGNITEDMDGSIVSCEYAQSQNGSGEWAAFSERVEAVLNVFKVTIETAEDVCDTCVGDTQLVFKESIKSSPGETNVSKRIKSKITEMTNLKSEEIFVHNFQYSVSLPIDTVNTNQAIMAMKPKSIMNENVTDTWPCKCGSGTPPVTPTVKANQAILNAALLLTTASSVLSVQMEWGENPDLVDESVPIQGREHIKPMVVLEGESIELECKVIFTNYPISQIIWREDGELNGKPKDQTVEPCGDEYVCVLSHFAKGPATEEMDGRTVYCDYSKGWDYGRLEADLHVFTLEIEISDNGCGTCEEIGKLVFNENQRVTFGGAFIDQRIKVKITEMTNVKSDDITHEESEFSVTVPMCAVKANQAILAMKPKLIRNGIPVNETLDQYTCESAGGNSNILIGIIIVIVAISIVVLVLVKVARSSLYHKCVKDGDDTSDMEANGVGDGSQEQDGGGCLTLSCILDRVPMMGWCTCSKGKSLVEEGRGKSPGGEEGLLSAPQHEV